MALISVYNHSITGNTILEPQQAFVIRVIDGDTIETNQGTVRLLGINSPEKNKPYFKESKKFLSQIENKTIYLIKEGKDKGKYKRLLRYVIYNNRNLNIELVEQGLANTYMIDNLAYKYKLQRAQLNAQKQKLGIWKKSNHSCSSCIKLQKLDQIKEYFILENICNYNCDLKEWTVKDSGRNTFKLSLIKANKKLTINSTKQIWNNNKDEFFLRDSQGLLVIYYQYEL